MLATDNNLHHLAEVFRGALNQELGMRNAEKVRIRALANLYSRDRMTAAFDKYVKAINADGCTVNAIRLEFDGSDGTTYVADIAPPESQKVAAPDGKKITSGRIPVK